MFDYAEVKLQKNVSMFSNKTAKRKTVIYIYIQTNKQTKKAGYLSCSS